MTTMIPVVYTGPDPDLTFGCVYTWRGDVLVRGVPMRRLGYRDEPAILVPVGDAPFYTTFEPCAMCGGRREVEWEEFMGYMEHPDTPDQPFPMYALMRAECPECRGTGITIDWANDLCSTIIMEA